MHSNCLELHKIMRFFMHSGCCVHTYSDTLLASIFHDEMRCHFRQKGTLLISSRPADKRFFFHLNVNQRATNPLRWWVKGRLSDRPPSCMFDSHCWSCRPNPWLPPLSATLPTPPAPQMRRRRRLRGFW